ncbi:hypothetical protein [Streptomyces sp. NPDC101234]|uniref:hypothetical protein n=1 Tax=Streptomyces sp. NPDC101234 TaxID=3366138 RepID=UPI00381808E0
MSDHAKWMVGFRIWEADCAVGRSTWWTTQPTGPRRAGHGHALLPTGLHLTSGKVTFHALAEGQLAVDEAVASQRLDRYGELDSTRLFSELFRLPDGQPTTA